MDKPASSFMLGMETPSQVAYPPAFAAALRRMGLDFLVYYANTLERHAGKDAPALQVDQTMRRLAAECGCRHALSCHTQDPPEAVLRANLGDPAYLGVVYDEIEHCRCLWPCTDDTLIPKGRHVNSFTQACEETLDAYRRLRAHMEETGGGAMVATHIWPVMHHVSARAGCTVCPKICKELYTPVAFAVGLGAALQYDVPLWADIDLWFHALVPGHPHEELWENLVFAYRMGADAVYIEGAGLNLAPAGHQGPPFTMFHIISDNLFQLTPHGEVVRRFTQEYLPAHPRDYTFRDIKPDVAIVRFEDSCHGQRYADPAFGDRLYGQPNLHSSEATEE